MKDKEKKLQKEEGKVQVLKYAIDIMEKEESELLSNLTKTPLTSGKYSSSHMSQRILNQLRSHQDDSFKPHLYGLDNRPLSTDGEPTGLADKRNCKSVEALNLGK